MNDVRLLQFQESSKEVYTDKLILEVENREPTNGQKLKALREFLGKSPYFKGVISEDGFDLFVPKKFREDLQTEWYPVDPSYMTVIKETEEKLIYREKLKDLLQ